MNSLVLDVAIALITLFFLLAIVCASVGEMISGMLNLRGKTLWEGIQSLLLAQEKVASVNGKEVVEQNPGARIAYAMLSNPLVAGKVPDRFGLFDLYRWLVGSRRPAEVSNDNKPSYLKSETFAAVLVEELRKQYRNSDTSYTDLTQAIRNMPACDLKKILESFITSAAGDEAKYSGLLQAWFDETMERVSGWYKRRSQALLFLIGLLVAVTLNVDTLRIADHLWNDKAVREQLVATGTSVVNAGADKATSQQAVKDLKQVSASVPVGWPATWWPKSEKPLPVGATLLAHQGDVILMLTGWLLTALAASVGAPIWFDLLNRLISMRSAVKPAATAAPAAVPPSGAAPTPATAAPSKAKVSPNGLAMNDYEALLLDDGKVLRIKRQLERRLDCTLGTDTSLDIDTRDAVKGAQARLGMPVTGQLSATLIHHLFDAETKLVAAVKPPGAAQAIEQTAEATADS